jgi:hypothetical protein
MVSFIIDFSGVQRSLLPVHALLHCYVKSGHSYLPSLDHNEEVNPHKRFAQSVIKVATRLNVYIEHTVKIIVV